MNTSIQYGASVTLNGAQLTALPSGALWWAEQSTLCVSDLHLGKAERMARRGGTSLPPYETRNTLDRLSTDLDATQPARVICLGDSFDDLAASKSIRDTDRRHIAQMQAGRDWIWIEGNHDPGPIEFGGTHMGELYVGPLLFRHIAQVDAQGEVSGHYHPKAAIQTRARRVTRPAFLMDEHRMILPAFGTYTGGLWSHDPAFDRLFGADATAILTGTKALVFPMPRAA